MFIHWGKSWTWKSFGKQTVDGSESQMWALVRWAGVGFNFQNSLHFKYILSLWFLRLACSQLEVVCLQWGEKHSTVQDALLPPCQCLVSYDQEFYNHRNFSGGPKPGIKVCLQKPKQCIYDSGVGSFSVGDWLFQTKKWKLIGFVTRVPPQPQPQNFESPPD